LIHDDASPAREVPHEPRNDEALTSYNDYLRSVHAKSSEKPKEY